MPKFPFNIRYEEVATIDATDGMMVDVEGDDVPKRITLTDLATAILTTDVDYSTNFLLGGM